MIKYICNICKKEINMNTDGVSVMFHTKDIYSQNTTNEDLHLCKACCKRVKDFISSASAEGK